MLRSSPQGQSMLSLEKERMLQKWKMKWQLQSNEHSENTKRSRMQQGNKTYRLKSLFSLREENLLHLVITFITVETLEYISLIAFTP